MAARRDDVAGREDEGRLGARIGAYLDHLSVERGLAGNTLAAYRRDLARYRRFLLDREVLEVDQVTGVEVEEFAADLAASDLARASVARTVVAVRGFHRFCLEEGICGSDPAADVSPPRPPARLPKALSVDEVTRLIDGIARQTWRDLRDACLLELLYGAGARISELCALDVDDAPAPEEGLRLLGKGSKERIVPLGGPARASIDEWLVRGRPEVAARGRGVPSLLLDSRGERLSRQAAWAAVKARAESVGLRLSPHTLRHSYATHLLDGGADVRVVQELLGHSSVATTQVYTLVTLEGLRAVHAAAHPRAR